MEKFFNLANALIFPQWILMLVAPRWRVTQWLVRSFLIPALLAALYIYLLANGEPLDFKDFGSWAGIKKLFSNGNEPALLAGWIHYLAFDLTVGSLILLDAQAKKIPHLWIVLPLVACFILGPSGLLLYVLVRVFKK